MVIDLLKNNKTLRQILVGIVIYGILIEIILLIISKDRVYSSIGLLIGIVTAMGCVIHMAYGIEIAVMLDEKGAIAYTRKYTVIRYVVMCLVLVVTGVLKIGNPVTLIFGFLGLKAGAYLNPIINKFGGGEKE